jgi:hypothetical protein
MSNFLLKNLLVITFEEHFLLAVGVWHRAEEAVDIEQSLDDDLGLWTSVARAKAPVPSAELLDLQSTHAKLSDMANDSRALTW